MKGHQENCCSNADSSRRPRHIPSRPLRSPAKQGSTGEKRCGREEFTIPSTLNFMHLAPVLMDTAQNRQHHKATKEDNVAGPSIHQQMAYAEQDKSNEGWVPRHFQNASRAIAQRGSDCCRIGI